MRLKIIAFIVLFFVLSTTQVSAHPGRTDASGGHTCRTNCEKWGYGYGEYHTHGTPNNSAGTSAITKPVYPTNTPTPVINKNVAHTTALPTKKPTPGVTPYLETDMDKKKLFKVVRIIDGDTIVVSIRGKQEKVRLIGIDTPETVDPRKPVACFGKEATAKLTSLIKGQYVKLMDDKLQGNKDAYKRLLRFVYMENGIFVNKEMISQGYAFSYKQYPSKYLEEFNKLEKQAREKNLGLWNACK